MCYLSIVHLGSPVGYLSVGVSSTPQQEEKDCEVYLLQLGEQNGTTAYP